MRYQYQKGIVRSKKKSRKAIVGFSGISLIAGAYLLVNSLSPMVPDYGAGKALAERLTVSQPFVEENRLYVPKLGIDTPIVEIGDDETAALEKGAIHRSPSSGNPLEGGNFVLAAHRFNLGLTPAQTRAKSPFYFINEMKEGDQVYLDYKGVRYAYEVTGHKKVAEDDVYIEDKTSSPQLTLYSCDLRGARAGREVIVAEPLGKVAWKDGTPKIVSDKKR